MMMFEDETLVPLMFGLIYVEEAIDAYKIIHLLSRIFYTLWQLAAGHLSTSGQ